MHVREGNAMTKLADYLKSKREEQALAAADAARIKEEWLRQLEELMSCIDKWLEPATQEGLKITKTSVEKNERMLGAYTAPKRVIEFAGRKIEIEPIARIIVGGNGRVDIRSTVGRAFLIFSKAEGRWAIVNDRDWTTREPLTNETFERVMEAFL